MKVQYIDVRGTDERTIPVRDCPFAVIVLGEVGTVDLTINGSPFDIGRMMGALLMRLDTDNQLRVLAALTSALLDTRGGDTGGTGPKH